MSGGGGAGSVPAHTPLTGYTHSLYTLMLPPSVSGVSECRCDGSNPSWKGSGRRNGRDLTRKMPPSLG